MLNLKQQLEGLIELQGVDSEIYILNNEKSQEPVLIKELETAFQAKKQSLADAEKNYLEAQKQKKDRELELGSKEESIKKLQSQLYQLKTNKEYQTMLQQIQDAKADFSVIEDKILESIENVDKAKSSIDKEKNLLSGEEKLFLEKKQTIVSKAKEIEERLKTLDVRRKQILPSIDKSVLNQYERILKNRDGLAIVPAVNESCQGCHMNVPPQAINLIRMYEKIIICESCGRILFLKDA